MQPVRLTCAPASLNSAGYASNVTGATFVLTANVPGDGLAHLVTILNNTANSHAGKTITIVGLNADGGPLTETITGPGASTTVTSTKYFSRVNSVTPSATIGADTFNIGWTAVAISRTVPLNREATDFKVGLAVVVSGTINYTVQHTFDWLSRLTDSTSATWFPHATMAAQTTNLDGNYNFPCVATRLVINSFSASATATFYVIQGQGA